MSKIDKLEMKAVLIKVGFPSDFNVIRGSYKYNADIERIFDFEIEFSQVEDFKNGYTKLMTEYEDIFDKELYVFKIAQYLRKHIEDQKRKSILENNSEYSMDDMKLAKIFYESAIGLLKDIDIVDAGIGVNTGDIIITSSQEFLGNKSSKRKVKAEERLKQIEDSIGLKNIINYLVPSDLINICRYPNLGNLLANRLYKKNEEELKGSKFKDGVFQLDDVIDEMHIKKGNVFDWREFETFVREYIEYIDIDKMLLLANSVYYNKYGNDFHKFDIQDASNLKTFTGQIESLLENKNAKIDSPRFLGTIEFKTIKKSVESLNKHFINGRYYKDDEISDLANKIISGDVPITFITKKEFIETMQFTTQELATLLTNQPQDLEYIVENEFLKENQLNEIIDLKTSFSDEQILYLVSNDILDDNKVLELYKEGKVSLENIKFLKENLQEKDLSELVSEKRLIELYSEPKQKEEFDKYRKLYRLLKIDGTSIESQMENANQILAQSMDLIEEEKLYELYHMGLIPIDTVVDYVGNSAVKNLYSAGELKPIDSRRLYENGIMNEEMFAEVFKDSKLPNTEKLVLIYSTFSSITDKKDIELREKFIKLYIPQPQKGEYEGKKGNCEKRKENKSSVVVNKSVTDPCARWNLISMLDKDYSQEYLRDGSIIFYLPSKGKYIIERLYDSNHKPAYGSATYILDEDLFEKQKDTIIQNKKVNTSNLVALRKNNEAGIKKIIHTGWGNALVRFFEVENPKKYTKEECENIRKLAKEVEKSKKTLTRDE